MYGGGIEKHTKKKFGGGMKESERKRKDFGGGMEKERKQKSLRRDGDERNTDIADGMKRAKTMILARRWKGAKINFLSEDGDERK